MRRYEIVHLLARRLSLKVGRVQAILSKLQEAQLIASPGPDKARPVDMAEPEIVKLLVALLGESGITSAPDAVQRFGPLIRDEVGRISMGGGQDSFGRSCARWPTQSL